MTERELIEAAAKAMGHEGAEWQDMTGWGEVRYGFTQAVFVPALETYWNPLEDDADAFRLAVKLRLHVSHILSDGAHVQWDEPFAGVVVEPYADGDPLAATRRAITRAAAAIGQQNELAARAAGGGGG